VPKYGSITVVLWNRLSSRNNHYGIHVNSICFRIWLGSKRSVGSKYWPIRHLGVRSVCFVGQGGGGWECGILFSKFASARGFTNRRVIYTVYSSALFSATSKKALEPTRHHVQWIQLVRLAGGKWTESNADHSPPSDGERYALLFFMGRS